MKDELKEALLNRSADGRISCAAARKIAEDLKLDYRDVGAAADELKIRIQSCQLGCF